MNKLFVRIVTMSAMLFTFFVLPGAAKADPVGMECYKAKDASSFSKELATLTLSSAWGSRVDCRPSKIKAKLFCSPSTVTIVDDGNATGGNPATPPNLEFEHMTCYKVKCDDAVMPGTVLLEDAYGGRPFEKPKLVMYCIPAE